MYSVLLTIHVLVTLFLIGIILMQRSASDGMGLSASSSTSFLSGRAAASAVTRATSILAALFILTSLCLGIITARGHGGETSILDRPSTSSLAPGASSSVTPKPTEPAGTATAPSLIPAEKTPVPRPQ